MSRTEDEMNVQINRARNVADRKGTLFRGMTYEQGVADVLEWAMENIEDKPLGDDDYSDFDE